MRITRTALAILALLSTVVPFGRRATLLASPPVEAQQRGAPPPPGGQRGGGGRGRGAVQTMTMQSSAFADGGQIPIKHTQVGEEASPALAWSNAPEGVASYVLIVHDVDAAIGPGTDHILQWLLGNIPPAVPSLSERL